LLFLKLNLGSHLGRTVVKGIIRAELTKLLSHVAKDNPKQKFKRPADGTIAKLSMDVTDGLKALEQLQQRDTVVKAGVTKANTRKPSLPKKTKKGTTVKFSLGKHKKQKEASIELAKSRRRNLEKFEFGTFDERIEALLVRNPKVAATISRAAKKLHKFFIGHSNRFIVNLMLKKLIKTKLAILLSTVLQDQLQNKRVDIQDPQLLSDIDRVLSILEDGLSKMDIAIRKVLTRNRRKQRTPATKRVLIRNGRKVGLEIILYSSYWPFSLAENQ
jgi:hypothetical protein